MRRCACLRVLQDAVCTLNTLQTNASCLQQVRRERHHPQLQLQAMEGFLERAGLTVSRGSSGQRSPLSLKKKMLKGLRISATMILFPASLSDGLISKVEELDHLNIIHVTGTKGKVSVAGPAPAVNAVYDP